MKDMCWKRKFHMFACCILMGQMMFGGRIDIFGKTSPHVETMITKVADSRVKPIFSLERYQKNENLSGFTVTNQYLNSQNQVIGLRLIHHSSLAVIHFLQMDTNPQGALAVKTYTDSDAGIAHILEHALLRRGKQSRVLKDVMESTSATIQRFAPSDATWYYFDVATNIDGFYRFFQTFMKTLLHPNFEDDELLNETYYMGVEKNQQTGKRQIVEFGNVYAESQTQLGIDHYFYEGQRLALGEQHPLSYPPIGSDDRLRTVTSKEIRSFYQSRYALGQTMTFIWVIPQWQDPIQYLAKMNYILNSQLPIKKVDLSTLEKGIHPTSVVHPEIRMVPFPSKENSEQSRILFMWKPILVESSAEFLQFSIFLDVFHSLFSREIYQDLESFPTRSIMKLEPTYYSSKTFLMYLDVEGCGVHLTKEQLVRMRQRILEKINQISRYQPGSRESITFQDKAIEFLKERQRQFLVWEKNPPQFGIRDLDKLENEWNQYFPVLDLDGNFQKSLVFQNAFSQVQQQITSNPFLGRELIVKMKITEPPYGIAGVPSPLLFEQNEQKKKIRIYNKILQLKEKYQVKTEEEALIRFEKEQDLRDRKRQNQSQWFPFSSQTRPSVPVDDQIRYQQKRVASIPSLDFLFSGPSMTEMAFFFDVKGVPSSLYKYLPLMPSIIMNARSYSHSSVKKTYSLGSFFDFNGMSNRYELKIYLTGISQAELRSGLQEMPTFLHQNYFKTENLPWLKDHVVTVLENIKTMLNRPVEEWIETVADDILHEKNFLYLTLHSFFTQEHFLQRVQWQLQGPLPLGEWTQLKDFSEETIKSLEGMTPEKRSVFLLNLSQKTNGMHQKLTQYWLSQQNHFSEEYTIEGLKKLSLEVLHDVQIGKEQTLIEWGQLWQLLLNQAPLRMYQTGEQDTILNLQNDLEAFLHSFKSQPRRTHENFIPEQIPLVFTHLQQREPASVDAFPKYVSYLKQDSTTADLLVKTDFPGYQAKTENQFFEYLAPLLLTGSSAHSLQEKVRQHGFAYLNWLIPRPHEGKLTYIAGRCPSLLSIFQFLQKITRDLPMIPDPFYQNYIFYRLFDHSRQRWLSTEKAATIANEIQDGATPETLRLLYQKMFMLGQKSYFVKKVRQFLPILLNRLMIGQGSEKDKAMAHTLFLWVASKQQLHEVQSKFPNQKIYQIWQSDFWLP